MIDKMEAVSVIGSGLVGANGLIEGIKVRGRYVVECRDKDGNLRWTETIDNVVCTLGKNLMFNTAFTGSAYTVTGPFMGLISGTSYTAVAAADTMTSHTGWLEAGNANAPQYSGSRPTCVWSAASGGAIVLSAALNFTFTAGGTVQGAFVNFGSGASATIDNTGGTLWSAGVFGTGARTVLTGDAINVSYSASM
jgi:hypothetical protein